MSPSPRLSADNAHGPSSPFLHNLSQRLRKGSNASYASSQSSETTHSNAENVNQPPDARSTKSYLLSLLKDDWEYPTTQTHKNDLKIHRDATGYRLRDESVSEYESSSGRRSISRDGDPYRFDNPDDVGAAVERRKARKRRLLEQEMSWNEGLRIWTLRRDAWTGAMHHKPQDKRHGSNGHRHKRPSRDGRHRNSSVSTSRSSISAPSWLLLSDQNGADVGRDDTVIMDNDLQIDLSDGPYLPIYPPLLPASHALRSRIKPSAYPTLYSKVVVQGLAPNVPIPLNHMISALVEGWKAEGNWPPPFTAPETLSARKKFKKGESAFQKWKREQDEKKIAALQKSQELQYEQEAPEHKGIRKSIGGAMKKALGIGGGIEGEVDRDLEKIGLTFEVDQESESEVPAALQAGHV